MPCYSYQCQKCNSIFDLHSSVEDRNNTKKCKCGGTSIRNLKSELATIGDVNGLLKENIRYSYSLGCRPSQLEQKMKQHPGARFVKKGCGYVMEIKNRAEKLQRMKEAGMSEYNPRDFE